MFCHRRQKKKSNKCRSDQLHHKLLRSKIESRVKQPLDLAALNVFYNSNKSEQSQWDCVKVMKRKWGISSWRWQKMQLSSISSWNSIKAKEFFFNKRHNFIRTKRRGEKTITTKFWKLKSKRKCDIYLRILSHLWEWWETLWHCRTSKMSGIVSMLYFCKGVKMGLNTVRFVASLRGDYIL